tara:strand:- start:175 stop:876 length:702 start_codon:yes stop_codon:yes gene_type:complete
MSFELLTSRENSCLIISFSLNNNENFISSDICTAGIEALSTAEKDKDINSVILTCPENNFYQKIVNHNFEEKKIKFRNENLDYFHSLIEIIYNFPKIIISAFEGEIYGAGFSIILASDIIITSKQTVFYHNHFINNHSPFPGIVWFFTKLFSRQLINKMLISKSPLSSETLYNQGIICELTNKGDTLSKAVDFCNNLKIEKLNEFEKNKTLIKEAAFVSYQEFLKIEKKITIK